MDGARERFSGVIMFPVRHPIELAQTLQNLTGCYPITAAELCENSRSRATTLTDLRLQEWIQEQQEFRQKMAGVVAEQELVEPNNARRGNRRCGAG